MLARLVPTACLICLLGSLYSGEAASQSCMLSDGDSIGAAIRRGCTNISLSAGEYAERLTINEAISIGGTSDTADPLAVVITANGGPVITVGIAGSLQLSRVTLRGSGGEIAVESHEIDEPEGDKDEAEDGLADGEGGAEEADGEAGEAEHETEEAEAGADDTASPTEEPHREPDDAEGEPDDAEAEPEEAEGEAGVVDGETTQADGEIGEAEGDPADVEGEDEEVEDETVEAVDEMSPPEAPAPTPDLNQRSGCIHNSGRTTIDNVLVVGCYAAESGGAVYNEAAASFTARSSIFDSNRAAAGPGGAIASGPEGTLTLQDTDFTRNVAQGWGGAVSSAGIVDGVTGSFYGNRAGGHGGALALLGSASAVLVDGVIFDSNQAEDYGGAIACQDRELAIRGGEIRANRAQGGGGLYAARCAVTIDRSKLLANTAGASLNGFGGALMLQEGSVRVTDGWFEGNQAGHSGGALFANARPTSVTLEETTLRDNHAQVAGGGIRVAEAELMWVHGSTLVFNSAGLGGGAHVSHGSGTIERSAFSGNRALGEAFGNRALGELSGNRALGEFSGHRALGEGGAMLISDASMVIENSTFASNVADVLGGAFAMRGTGESSIRSATLYRNTAGERASGLFIDSGAAVGLSNTIVYDSGTTIDDCEVEGTLTVSGRNLDSDGSCEADVSRDPQLELQGPGATIESDDSSSAEPAHDESFVDPPPGDEQLSAAAGAIQTSAIVADEAVEVALVETPGTNVVPLALQPTVGSPVIDAGDDEVCTDQDQNGTERPRDGDGIDGAGCDIGAIEKASS